MTGFGYLAKEGFKNVWNNRIMSIASVCVLISCLVLTGAAALLMQWGIVMGNDRFMYGEKLKAALIDGSKPVGLVGITRNDNQPDPRTGWGAVCLKNTLNKIL